MVADANVQVGRILWEAWDKLQDFIDGENRPFPWIVPTMIVQMILIVIILLFWSLRLYKEGRKLLEPSHEKETETKLIQSKESDEELFELAKSFVKAKLYLQNKFENSEKERLVEYLSREFGALIKSQGNKKVARKIIMMRIRCILVSNPYDQLGRKMAAETKTIFLRNVLGETKWWHKYESYIIEHAKFGFKTNLLVYLPIGVALLQIFYSGSIYVYDLVSDYRVIQEISYTSQHFRIPNLMGLANSTGNKLSDIIFQDYPKAGLQGMKEPCRYLDSLEQGVIAEDRTGIFRFFISRADTHFNPVRNSTFHISEMFELGAEFLGKINKIVTDKELRHLLGMNSDFGQFETKSIPEILESIEKKAENGFFKTLQSIMSAVSFAIPDAKEKTIREYLRIPDIIRKNIGEIKKLFEHKIMKHILRKLDAERDDSRTYKLDDGFQEIFEAFHTTLNTIWKPEEVEKFVYDPSPDPFQTQLNISQIECRKYVRRLFKLYENPVFKKIIITFLERRTSKMQETTSAERVFLTLQVMESAIWFLKITLILTILREIVACLIKMIKLRHWPLYSNFKLNSDEARALPLLTEKNTSNKYVVQASGRADISVSEATKETISAINIQVAIWMYMATLIFKVKTVFSKFLKVDSKYISDDWFGLNKEAGENYSNFYNSAVFTSLVAGMVSLTFAQYKHYMTRHAADCELKGKLIYFLACFSNSVAVFLSQTAYYTIGLPFLVNVLIIMIQEISGANEFEGLPKSNPSIIVVLIFVAVIMPLKVAPILFSKLLKFFTGEILMQQTRHLNGRTRSGYNVTDTANFMFLPSATNCHNHINSVTAGAGKLSPGFYYFRNHFQHR